MLILAHSYTTWLIFRFFVNHESNRRFQNDKTFSRPWIWVFLAKRSLIALKESVILWTDALLATSWWDVPLTFSLAGYFVWWVGKMVRYYPFLQGPRHPRHPRQPPLKHLCQNDLRGFQKRVGVRLWPWLFVIGFCSLMNDTKIFQVTIAKKYVLSRYTLFCSFVSICNLNSSITRVYSCRFKHLSCQRKRVLAL